MGRSFGVNIIEEYRLLLFISTCSLKCWCLYLYQKTVKIYWRQPKQINYPSKCLNWKYHFVYLDTDQLNFGTNAALTRFHVSTSV